MSEMLERVAKALAKAERMEANEDRVINVYAPLARAAIEAMRSYPPQDMILAGYNALMDWDARTGEDYGIAEIWRAMIDEALGAERGKLDVLATDRNRAP